ncbi:hypothetical protein GCM10010286_15230 [Streptomyces toxytricini]|nr:hypothetical protein GCM10010286_15230 [Streptomyces toxytricini]
MPPPIRELLQDLISRNVHRSTSSTSEPDLVVLGTTVGDEDSVRAFRAALEDRWSALGMGTVRRVPASLVLVPGYTPTRCAGTGRLVTEGPGQAAIAEGRILGRRERSKWLS